MLILYLGAIAYMTLLFRESGKAGAEFLTFKAYRQFFTDAEARADIIRNIWLFVPLGAILFRLCPDKKMLLLPKHKYHIYIHIKILIFCMNKIKCIPINT